MSDLDSFFFFSAGVSTSWQLGLFKTFCFGVTADGGADGLFIKPGASLSHVKSATQCNNKDILTDRKKEVKKNEKD